MTRLRVREDDAGNRRVTALAWWESPGASQLEELTIGTDLTASVCRRSREPERDPLVRPWHRRIGQMCYAGASQCPSSEHDERVAVEPIEKALNGCLRELFICRQGDDVAAASMIEIAGVGVM
jgi:hypothetical protein